MTAGRHSVNGTPGQEHWNARHSGAGRNPESNIALFESNKPPALIGETSPLLLLARKIENFATINVNSPEIV